MKTFLNVTKKLISNLINFLSFLILGKGLFRKKIKYCSVLIFLKSFIVSFLIPQLGSAIVTYLLLISCITTKCLYLESIITCAIQGRYDLFKSSTFPFKALVSNPNVLAASNK